MEEKEPTLKEIDTSLKDIMGFLQEHMVTHEDLKRSQNKLKQEILDAVNKNLTDLKGELVSLIRGIVNQLSTLVVVLQNKRVLSKEEAERLLSLNPFPQSV
ncbi:MAG: hypothetical protein ABIH67_05840 [Candidatus Uhrbacteria bacterium]